MRAVKPFPLSEWKTVHFFGSHAYELISIKTLNISKLLHIRVTKTDPRFLQMKNNFSEPTDICQCVVVKRGKKLSKLSSELCLPRI